MPLRTPLDSELFAESLKSLADELGPIVMNDPSWHTEAVNNVMFNEFNHVMRSAVQSSRDCIIVEFRGFPSNGCRLFGVSGRMLYSA